MMLVILAPVGATAKPPETKANVRWLGEELDIFLRVRGRDEIEASRRSSDVRCVGDESRIVELEFDKLRATDTIHYLSFFILDPDGENPGYVGFEVNADASADSLYRLLATCPAILRTLFGECEQ